MQIEEIKKNIYHIKEENQYLLSSTFLRVQEFYESKYPHIRNNYFTLEDYIDTYTLDRGKFDYFTEFVGFNLPGYIFVEFFKIFENRLLKKERKLKKLIIPIIRKNDLFYVIATTGEIKNVLNHEIAHAFYYLNLDYRGQVKQLITEFDDKLKKLKNGLLEIGYCENVLEDELQAYLATGCDVEKINKIKIPRKITKAFKRVFNIYNKNL